MAILAEVTRRLGSRQSVGHTEFDSLSGALSSQASTTEVWTDSDSGVEPSDTEVTAGIRVRQHTP